MLADYPLDTIIAAQDIDRSKAWYADKIGWAPASEVPEAGVAVYKVGSSTVTIYQTDSAGTAKNTVANWNVVDLKATMASLRGNGVTFEEYDFGDYKTVDGVLGDAEQGFFNAWFKDPDGNTWGVLQFPGSGDGSTISPMLAAHDLDRAKAWYAEKLDLQAGGTMPDQVLEFSSGGATFSVYRTDFAGTAKNTVAGWIVPDLREEMTFLKAGGIRFEDYDFGEWKTVDGVMTEPSGSLTSWFKDSEGNVLGLREDRAG